MGGRREEVINKMQKAESAKNSLSGSLGPFRRFREISKVTAACFLISDSVDYVHFFLAAL